MFGMIGAAAAAASIGSAASAMRSQSQSQAQRIGTSRAAMRSHSLPRGWSQGDFARLRRQVGSVYPTTLTGPAARRSRGSLGQTMSRLSLLYPQQ